MHHAMSMSAETNRTNGSRPPLPRGTNISEKPEAHPETPTSIQAINDRATSNVKLVMGVITENLDGLRRQMDEMEKSLEQDAQRLLRVQADFVHSAGVLLNMKDSAGQTLNALRAGRARLVAVADGEPMPG